MSNLLLGLPPHIAADCRVLVLGSMPGDASLSVQQYYAHPRNRFWPLLAQICRFDPALAYPQRLAALQAAGFGLWDVIGQCRRAGSLDSAIVRGSEVINPIGARLPALPRLRAIALNGGKAAQAFARHLQPQLPADALAGIDVFALPSTSPANAGFSLERLWQHWRVLADY
ncbi:DNA-deoxyinosine glycosylase [Pseudoxanthomonas wuyuanensis]|uniref:G/U mismatch-specific uracil-DNA glycosylase n=1 Tax=Pseudoxanthomonas wuyuanensis TaxID=1073196 RepID=A0A286DB50_9GAMM|nr:DNA-deoxyinosine glycosylase [Pseudoxanthomonas wuyuanensis]KAF1721794.1 DNA-deoxyinosine glycosylase [Pseudoxanthomonas wuyuanensis]SOD55863.1 G/U mismatch-specific uracil-DNA glycosylase [Pseudoxanthomonas wuyuanensis]